MEKLHRDPSRLDHKRFDVVIVGGGIFGAAAAWEAASRGLSVALLEKGDFSHATSSNHFKMIHGGIRYLQHMDIRRIRESAHERSALLRIAPHLAKPLPIVIPTYGYGTKGKGFVGTGMGIYDLLTYDRNRHLSASRRIPSGRFLSRQKVLRSFPGICPDHLTGGALFYDGQMTSPSRLVISFIRSAVSAGAVVCNYLEVNDFIRMNNRIKGVEAIDLETGEQHAIEGRMVLITAGPWANRLLESTLGLQIKPAPTFSRDLAFLVPRRFEHPMAIAFSTHSHDSDSIIDRGGRHLFAVPWKDSTLIGVWHKVYKKSPDQIEVDRSEIQAFINEVNTAYSGLNLTMEEVRLINTGLTLYGDENNQGDNSLSFGKRSLLIDHRKTNGVGGLMSLIGVRATTARGMAKKAIDRLFTYTEKPFVRSQTHCIPLFGGGGPDLSTLFNLFKNSFGDMLSDDQISSLLELYGSQLPRVLRYATENTELFNSIGSTATLFAEIVHSVTEEMAIHLDDILYRRVELGTSLQPSDDVLSACAEVASSIMGWDSTRIQEEIVRAKSNFPSFDGKF